MQDFKNMPNSWMVPETKEDDVMTPEDQMMAQFWHDLDVYMRDMVLVEKTDNKVLGIKAVEKLSKSIRQMMSIIKNRCIKQLNKQKDHG